MRFSHASDEVIEGKRPRSCLNFKARFASLRASSTVRPSHALPIDQNLPHCERHGERSFQLRSAAVAQAVVLSVCQRLPTTLISNSKIVSKIVVPPDYEENLFVSGEEYMRRMNVGLLPAIGTKTRHPEPSPPTATAQSSSR